MTAGAVLALCALALSPQIAFGCCSGLGVIPTAETVGADQYGVEFQFDGPFPVRSTDVYIINTEFGLGDRFEAGVDYDLSDGVATRALINAKYLLAVGTPRSPAVAVGVCSVGRHTKATPYAVLTQEFTGCRGHLGVMHTEDHNRVFVGVDKALAERWTVMADYTAGDEGWSSLGANYQFTDGFGVFAGAQFPNAGGEASWFTLHFVFSGPYR